MPFWQFLINWLIGWIGHALLMQPSISVHRKWPEMIVSASTNQVWTKITIRSYVWSFALQIQIQAVCLTLLPVTKYNAVYFLSSGHSLVWCQVLHTIQWLLSCNYLYIGQGTWKINWVVLVRSSSQFESHCQRSMKYFLIFLFLIKASLALKVQMYHSDYYHPDSVHSGELKPTL